MAPFLHSPMIPLSLNARKACAADLMEHTVHAILDPASSRPTRSAYLAVFLLKAFSNRAANFRPLALLFHSSSMFDLSMIVWELGIPPRSHSRCQTTAVARCSFKDSGYCYSLSARDEASCPPCWVQLCRWLFLLGSSHDITVSTPPPRPWDNSSESAPVIALLGKVSQFSWLSQTQRDGLARTITTN